MNNDYMCLGELADIAEDIINNKGLNESLLKDLSEFIRNYKSMQDILSMLQGELKDMARNNQSSRLMGDGTVLKAINSSKKVDIQMKKMNKDAKDFIKHFKNAIENGG